MKLLCFLINVYVWYYINVGCDRDVTLHLVRDLISMCLTMCHSHVYIIDVYNLFSFPITHCDGKRDCYFYFLIWNLRFQTSFINSIQYRCNYKCPVLVSIIIHHHTLTFTFLVFYIMQFIIFIYEKRLVYWKCF